MLEISLDQARRFILDIQGLRTSRVSRSVLDVARRIHNIQIDTISVVSRSHNLITYNRFAGYKEGKIWDALKNGQLFEYWSHAMCLIPIEAFPFYAWKMQHYPEKLWSNYVKWAKENEHVIESVYSHVKKNGATASATVGGKNEGEKGWWGMKAERMALEFLHIDGRLMVAYRKKFQKYYDIPERVLPANVDSEPMDDDQVLSYLGKTILGSLGLVSAEDMKSYMGNLPSKILWNGRRTEIEKYLQHLETEGLASEVQIKGVKERYFVLKKNASKLERAKPHDGEEVPMKLLSPFDNIIRERHIPRKMWGFNYKIECYVPKEKRVHGYYVLPLLDQDCLVGRVDAKADRKEERLEVIALYLEHRDSREDPALGRLANGLKLFAKFIGCSEIKIGTVYPKNIKKRILPLVEISE